MTNSTRPSRTPNRGHTQHERSASTQKAVLEATLQCMKKHGLANTTLQQIERLAKMTRGALLYHFPTKQALVAAALVYFYRRRVERLGSAVKSHKPDLRGGLHILHDEVREWFPLTLEFMNAMRTDIALRNAFDREMDQWVRPISDNYVTLMPELSSAESPLMLQYVIGCFLRGLCLESFVSEPGIVDKAFDQFVKILQAYLRKD